MSCRIAQNAGIVWPSNTSATAKFPSGHVFIDGRYNIVCQPSIAKAIVFARSLEASSCSSVKWPRTNSATSSRDLPALKKNATGMSNSPISGHLSVTRLGRASICRPNQARYHFDRSVPSSVLVRDVIGNTVLRKSSFRLSVGMKYQGCGTRQIESSGVRAYCQPCQYRYS